MAMPFAGKVAVPPEVLVQELDGESVFLNCNGRCYYGLDEVGTRMWQVLIAAESVQAAYDVLLAEYDVEPERLRQDLQNLLDNLEKHGLAHVRIP